MLHDNLPTNIFSISELPTFEFTRYSYSCTRREFSRSLNADHRPKATPRAASNSSQPHTDPASHDNRGAIEESDPILISYVSLLKARIPCEWRYSEQGITPAGPKSGRNLLERDLWVFWLTGKSQLKDHGLENLTECQSGNLSWDTVSQYNAPVASGSPQTSRPSAMSASANDMASASREYEIFICGLRNVLDRGLVVKGGYRLGESYVFPSSLQPRLDGSVLPSFPKISSLAMLSCTISMYLSSSNLIFQPTFQYHRLRTLTAMDLDIRLATGKDLEVLLSPHGTRAVLRLREMADFSEEQTERCIDGWEYLFGSKTEDTPNQSDALPRLVSVGIMSGQGELLVQYPTERVFVPVSCKESPSDVGELNGMGSRNLGFVEDLGAKFALWSWQERTRNAIASPAVPKLIQPVSENTPVLAEPRNRLKAGSSAWQQQQLQLQQQQQQQLQQQQLQQQQQSLFLQQQQEAYFRRTTNARHYDTNRIDYWSYMDPYAYLTSIVLNSCANAESKTAESPSAGDTQTPLSGPIPTSQSTRVRSVLPIKKEEDGWVRMRPKRSIMSAVTPHIYPTDIPVTDTGTWGASSNSGADQTTAGNIYNDPSQYASGTKVDAAPVETQSATTNSSYQLPIDLPADDNDMMSGLIDMDSMMGLYGAGNSDDLGDWGEVTNEDFSFFDKQPRSTAPSRAQPVTMTSSFESSLQSSIPMSSSTLPEISTNNSTIASTNGLMSAFSEMSNPFTNQSSTNPLDDDSLFTSMGLDISAFAQPTPPASTLVSMANTDKSSILPNGDFSESPLPTDQISLHQQIHDIGMLTPAPQASDVPLPLATQSPAGEEMPAMSDLTMTRRRPSLLVEHVHSPVQSYIPSSFSPLKVVSEYCVDESKYQAGGRFMYKRLYKGRRNSNRSTTQLRRESKHLPYYQPGKDQEWIVPHLKDKGHRSKRAKLSVSPLAYSTTKNDQGLGTTLHTTAWGVSALSLQSHRKKSSDGSASSDSDSGSSSNSSTSDSDDDSSGSSTPRPKFGKLTTISKAPNSWTVHGINSAKFAATVLTQSMQTSIGGKLLGVSPKTQYATGAPDDKSELEKIHSMPWVDADSYHANVEFDTPFMPAVLSAAPPALVHESVTVQESLAAEYFLETVRTLCEQGVLGEYPFAGSNEVTGTSGEISEGESFHLMLARRKTLLQQMREGFATVPALGDESFRYMMEMMSSIFDLFEHFRDNQGDNSMVLPIPSDASQDMAMSLGHHHHSSQSNITLPVVMKGPLTLLQLHALAEAQQMPSKYGKYQVKKKKPAEPAILQLPSPDIVVGHNEEWLEASPTILRFWEKLSLEPYSSKKNIAYFVVYPEGNDMENSVTKFWRELSVIFETSLLGSHQPGNVQDYKPGLVPISLLPALVGESTEARQVRSYVDGCQRLGLILGGSSRRKDVHTVVYMVNPFSHGSGYYDLCRCFSIMKTQFRTAALGSLLTPLEQQRERLVMQLVPIQHVLYPSTFGGYLRFGLRDIAFAVYTKCKIFMERPTYSGASMSQLNSFAPSFALAKTAPQTVNFDLQQTPNSVPRPTATLHVGYGFSLDGRWLICVWTDHRGEMLEHVALDMKGGNAARHNSQAQQGHPIQGGRRTLLSCLHEIWMKSKVYQKRGQFTWKTVVCKLGVMSQVELQEWARLAEGQANVAIVAVNIDSPLRMYPHNRGADHLVAGMTPGGNRTPSSTVLGASSVSAGVPGTPLQGNSSLTSTPLSQSMLPGHMSGISSSSTAVSTPDVNVTTPSTPLNNGINGGVGVASLGLGIGLPGSSAAGSGGAGRNQATGSPVAGGAGGMGGIGGMTADETLENSAGQVYAMILNHRVPLVVSRDDAGVAGVVLGEPVDLRAQKQTRLQPGSGAGTQKLQQQKSQKPVSYSGADEDSDMEEGALFSPSTEKDQDMVESAYASGDSSIKKEEGELNTSVKVENNAGSSNTPTLTALPKIIHPGSDVILPLTSGYLIQVPIQSNSVMRDKHSLESLGVEVHLLHYQRAAQPTTSNVGTGLGPGLGGAPSTLSLLSGSPTSSTFQLLQAGAQGPLQHSTAYHLQRHTPQSPLLGGRTNTSAQHLASISASSPSMSSSSPSSPFLPNNHHQRHASSTSIGSGSGGAQSSLGLGVSVAGSTGATSAAPSMVIPGAIGVKPTVAANATREILKQFHALSHLSMAPVQTNCLPNHLVLVERLSRLLLLVQD